MSTELMQALHDLGKEKGIEPEVILEAVEAALISAYKKNFGAAQNVQVNIDEVTGEFHVFTCYDVVEEVLNDKTEISLEEAQKRNPNYQIGEVVMEEVTPRNFGRIAAQTGYYCRRCFRLVFRLDSWRHEQRFHRERLQHSGQLCHPH